jgi:hypothetical protein
MIRWLLKPTPWLAGVGPGLVTAILVLHVILFAPMQLTLMAMAAVWLLVAGPYIVWSFARWTVTRGFAGAAELQRSDLQARKRVARAVVIGAILVLSGLPTRIVFHICRPSLDRYANHLYAEVPMQAPPSNVHWCGIYPVSSPFIMPNGVGVRVGIRRLAFMPDVNAPDQGLGGYWYDVGDADWPIHLPVLDR